MLLSSPLALSIDLKEKEAAEQINQQLLIGIK